MGQSFNYKALVEEAKASGAAEGFDPLPNGWYGATIDKSELKTTQKGDPMIVITWKITDDGEYKNRRIWHNMAFVPGNGVGLAINFRDLDTLGATSILENGGSLEQVAGFIKNKDAQLKLGLGKPYNGVVRNEVKDVKAPGSVTETSSFSAPSGTPF